MHTRYSLAVALITMACSTGCASHSAPSAADAAAPSSSMQDDAAVRGLLASLDEAWNRHDLDGFAALLTDEVQWIVSNGNCWRTKGKVRDAYFTLHQSLPAGAPMRTVRTGHVEVQMLGPTVAQGMATMMFGDGSNGADPDGPGWHTRASFVMVREARGWRIAQLHQTMLDPRIEREDPLWGDAARKSVNTDAAGR